MMTQPLTMMTPRVMMMTPRAMMMMTMMTAQLESLWTPLRCLMRIENSAVDALVQCKTLGLRERADCSWA